MQKRHAAHGRVVEDAVRGTRCFLQARLSRKSNAATGPAFRRNKSLSVSPRMAERAQIR